MEMYPVLLQIHSVLRWVLLLGLLGMIIKAVSAKNSPFTPLDHKGRLIVLISAHTQLLLGFGLYFISPLVTAGLADMAASMKNSELRFWAVEHIFGMVVAIAFITIGHVKSKKSTTDAGQFKALLVWYSLALAIIFATIPWPFRAVGAMRGWI